ncbi:MAG TPA: NADH-quinone oxidoreductase subunit A [Nitrospirae bacterium]|nr:NADH-quinone oxidoreductase subunit A [Nitrospirota bacterium]
MNPGEYIPINYLPVLITGIAATLFGLGALIIGEFLRLRRPYKDKLEAYESGNPPVGQPGERFSIRFYVIAMLFVVFDVEAVFLYPWAVAFGQIGIIGFWAMIAFLMLIFLGFLYDWKRGALE